MATGAKTYVVEDAKKGTGLNDVRTAVSPPTLRGLLDALDARSVSLCGRDTEGCRRGPVRGPGQRKTPAR